jgi:hypothetical protein
MTNHGVSPTESDSDDGNGDGRGSPDTSGFTPVEKVIGVAAAYKAPFLSSLAASFLLEKEADPVRREQLQRLRRGALIWGTVGVVVAIIGLIVILSWASASGIAGGSCKGGLDHFDPMDTTYESGDGTHWTASYPCNGGGFTTVPIPAGRVPGG